MSKRLPSVSAKDIVRALERGGFEIRRMSGSHCRLIHVSDPSRKTTVPFHTGDMPRGTLRDIIKQSGFTMEEFLKLL